MTSPSSRKRRRRYRVPLERGLGSQGGAWNVEQASEWSGIGSRKLREMAKRSVASKDPTLFPCHAIGRRILIPREAFMDWFNGRFRGTAV
jgi:hypothetical protein